MTSPQRRRATRGRHAWLQEKEKKERASFLFVVFVEFSDVCKLSDFGDFFSFHFFSFRSKEKKTFEDSSFVAPPRASITRPDPVFPHQRKDFLSYDCFCSVGEAMCGHSRRREQAVDNGAESIIIITFFNANASSAKRSNLLLPVRLVLGFAPCSRHLQGHPRLLPQRPAAATAAGHDGLSFDRRGRGRRGGRGGLPGRVRRANLQEEGARGGARGGGGEGSLFRLRFLELLFASWDRRRGFLQEGVRGVQVSALFF